MIRFSTYYTDITIYKDLTLDHLEHGRVLLEHKVSCISSIVQDHVWLPVLSIDAFVNAPPEVLLALSTPGKDRVACENMKDALKNCFSTLINEFSGFIQYGKKQMYNKSTLNLLIMKYLIKSNSLKTKSSKWKTHVQLGEFPYTLLHTNTY